MENLVKIDYKDLGKVFSNKLAIEENINISDDIRDWKDDISNASHETIEEKDNRYLDLCRIEYKDKNGIPSYLEFYEEYHLGKSKESLRMDILVIQKLADLHISKRIGENFQRYNIVEYKSPNDNLSVDDYYKVILLKIF